MTSSASTAPAKEQHLYHFQLFTDVFHAELTHVWCLQEATEYAKENDLYFIETSAKTALGVEELFKAIGELRE